MSETVSSNVLFHFTKSMDVLKSILKQGFAPRYCPEYSLDPLDRTAAAQGRPPIRVAPMVCFCDLPLSLIRTHLKNYGRFGIGLAKEWGIKNGLTPVIYTHTKAQTRQPIVRLTAKAAKDIDETAANDLKFLAAFTKPFRGAAWRSGKVKRNVRFYDEREWRYVPLMRGGEAGFLDWEDYNDIAKRDRLQKRFAKEYALRVQPNSIQYLILPYDRNEQNVLELHDFVMRLYGRRYNQKEAILVGTAIMTDNCIHEDV
jgi:Putative abortive phage resistance protein AbiGi, antitoxin